MYIYHMSNTYIIHMYICVCVCVYVHDMHDIFIYNRIHMIMTYAVCDTIYLYSMCRSYM